MRWHQVELGRRIIRFKFGRYRIGIHRGATLSIGFGFGVAYTYKLMFK